MANVGTYLNFPGTCAEAFDFYKSVFGAEMKPADQFWGDYWGSFADKFGTQWMVTVPGKKQ